MTSSFPSSFSHNAWSRKARSGHELDYFFNSALGDTVVQGDTNGDKVADFAIDLSGNIALTLSDLLGINLVPTAIETAGSTSLTEVANNFFLYAVGGSLGPELKYAGAGYVAGQFAPWVPIGAEQTTSGYEVAWKVAGAYQYTFWNTDSSGNYLSNITGIVSGTSSALQSLETSFHQDLNGDGHIGLPETLISGHADTFVFNPQAMGQVSVTDFTHAADLLDILSGAAPPNPGIEDYFTAGNAGAAPVGPIAGGGDHATAFAVHHPTDFHLI
jgi:hypothetical protein